MGQESNGAAATRAGGSSSGTSFVSSAALFDSRCGPNLNKAKSFAFLLPCALSASIKSDLAQPRNQVVRSGFVPCKCVPFSSSGSQSLRLLR
jgi:hypothetical protein